MIGMPNLQPEILMDSGEDRARQHHKELVNVLCQHRKLSNHS